MRNEYSLKMMEMVMRIFIFSLLIIFSFNNTGLADESIPDISKMSEEEINKLPKDVLDKLPAKEVYKRIGKEMPMAQLMQVMIFDSLQKLKYFDPISEEEGRKAVKLFQRDIGEAQTGILTMGQFNELSRRSTRISDTPVYLPTTGDNLRVYSHSGYVGAEGTWIIDGDKIYNPLNHNKISCFKSQQVCEVIQAHVDIPKIETKKDQYELYVSKDTFNIISWTGSEVISQAGAMCRTTIMTINIQNNEVFQITRNKGDNCDVGVAKLPQLNKPRISRLIPGWKLSWDFWKNRQKQTQKYFNPDALKSALEKFKNIVASEDKNKKVMK